MINHLKHTCVWLLIMVACKAGATRVYTLSEALEQGAVTAQIRGIERDSIRNSFIIHYNKCMQIELASTSQTDIVLNLENGYQLVPIDTYVQTMMITHAVSIKLHPGEHRKEALFAMCTEANDAGPNAKEHFCLGKRATGNLLALAGLIDRKNYQNDAAQNAVWCLTDNHDLFSVYSADTAMMYDLRRFVAKAKGIELTKIYQPYIGPAAEENGEQSIAMRTEYSGTFSYSLSRSSTVTLALYDANNRIKKMFVNNESQRPGMYTYEYQVSMTGADNDHYYLRMYKDGKREDEIKIGVNE